MKQNELKAIADSAAQKWGSIPLAIAVLLYGEAIIFDCNNQIPAWAEMDKINEIESQVNSFLNKTEQSNDEKAVSIATKADGAKQKEAEKVEEVKDETTEEKEFKDQTFIISDAELFQIVLDANKSNSTIGEAITRKLYGENPESVNAHQVGYVKGLITRLLNSQTAEKVEEVQPKEETPAEANTEPKTDELKADSEVKSESENAEVKPAI